MARHGSDWVTSVLRRAAVLDGMGRRLPPPVGPPPVFTSWVPLAAAAPEREDEAECNGCFGSETDYYCPRCGRLVGRAPW